jgi:hypothetical protein
MKPLFKPTDEVKLLSPTLYDEYRGVVTESEKVYQACYDDTELDPQGLRIRESDIASIQLPHSLKGDTLVIDHDYPNLNSRKYYKFVGDYAYTIKTEKMTAIYPEQALTLIKE